MFVGTRLETFLLTPRTSREQKQEWLRETKRFLDTHVGDSLTQSLNARFHSFWQAAKENNLDKLEQLQSAFLKRSTGSKYVVKTGRANVVAYRMPSLKAILGTTYAKAGQHIPIYPSVKGWFEVRVPDKDGVEQAEFIQLKDVKNKINYFGPVLVNRIKFRMKSYFRK
jgi:hypothetical protein